MLHTHARLALVAAATAGLTTAITASAAKLPAWSHPEGFQPPFKLPTADGKPLNEGEPYTCAMPYPIDFDGDGDTDLLIGVLKGREEGFIQICLNTGSDKAPVYAKPQLITVGENPLKLKAWSGPKIVACDLNNDGNLDLIVGASSVKTEEIDEKNGRPIYRGYIQYFEGKGNLDFKESVYLKDKAGDPIWASRCLAAKPNYYPQFCQSPMPCVADWDNDGDLDLIVGTNKSVFLFRNEGTASNPAFAVMDEEVTAGNERPLTKDPNHKTIGSSAKPSAIDWDNDGDLDLFVGFANGAIVRYDNVGTASNPKLAFADYIMTESSRKNSSYGTPYPVSVAAVDCNNDGYLDLLVGDDTGCKYFADLNGKQVQEKTALENELAAADAARAKFYKPLGVKNGLDFFEGYWYKSRKESKLKNLYASHAKMMLNRKRLRDAIEPYDVRSNKPDGRVWVLLRDPASK